MIPKKTTLLLVDDDKAITLLLKRVLTRTFDDEIEVVAFNDPQMAWDRIEKGGVDILVTDLDMPIISGLKMLECARNRNASTQAMMLTGHSTQDALLEAIEHGAIDYLVKPIDQEELTELVRQAIDRSKRWKLAILSTWKNRSQEVGAKG
ncbi:MAG: response regulator [Pirellulales bacterium]